MGEIDKVTAFKRAAAQDTLFPDETILRNALVQEAFRDNDVVTLKWGVTLPHPSASEALLFALADEHPAIEWLSQKITLDDDTGCWALHLAAEYDDKKRARYPTLSNVAFGARGELAHRFVWRRLLNPFITSDQHLDHLCRNHACCNPLHLEAVPFAENTARGREAVRAALGQSTLDGLSIYYPR